MTDMLLWWLILLAMGIGLLPLTAVLFRHFRDRGWLFSKVLSLLLCGWALFALTAAGAVPFTAAAARLAVVLISALCWILFLLVPGGKRPVRLRALRGEARLIFAEELLFLTLLILALYVIGFKPEASGTEKYMDYAFLTSMARSRTLPFEDPWFAGKTINYYYGGQYMAAFLMKCAGTSPGVAYNLMRALVTACSFMLPFSLCFQMMSDRIRRDGAAPRLYPAAAGLAGGLASAFCGNGHYLVYGLFLRLAAFLRGDQGYFYWFPDSTRFIGYAPDVPDKTIHEFPAYSSILGDLHAHYLNLIFVFAAMALAYACAQNREEDRRSSVLSPEILMIGLVTGLFRWINAADFPIYFVVCGSIVFFVNLRLFKGQIRGFLLTTAGQAVVIFAVGYAAALPFTLTFVPFTGGYGLVHAHSALWQLLILWGLPVGVLAGFALRLVFERRGAASPSFPALPDLTALLFGLCAAGLVLLPEIVYVKDIYGEAHHRSNTMFKLTYQAWVLFAVMMGYALIRALYRFRRARAGRLRTAASVPSVPSVLPAAAALMLLLLSAGYTVNGVSAWFGNVLNPAGRTGSDAAVFIEKYLPSDTGGVRWLHSETEGRPVVLEAPGDSYSEYGRISVATGLPTVAGWYVHEWLWRSGHGEMDVRIADIETIYTSKDPELVRDLVKQYGIRYLYIGEPERRKYPNLNETLLLSLFREVYTDGGTTILEA